MSAQTVLAFEHIASRRLEKETIALDMESLQYYTFNETAGLLWDMIVEKSSDEEMAEALCGRFDLSRARALADIGEFKSRLLKAGLAGKSQGGARAK